MNRRGFISLLAGAAGAPLVPWRHLLEPVIVLPARETVIQRIGGAGPYTYRWSWESSNGLTIVSPDDLATRFQGFGAGTARCDVTDSLGRTQSVFLRVSTSLATSGREPT